jgi:DNA-binding CsgD family transcriptional regulator
LFGGFSDTQGLAYGSSNAYAGTVGHLLVVYFFLCLASGLTALGLIGAMLRKTQEPFPKYLFLFFLCFTLLILYTLVYTYVRENVHPPSALLVAGLADGGIAASGFFLCSLLLFTNLLKLRKNGGKEWALSITASLLYCILALLAVVPDPASTTLYGIRQPWYTASIVTFSLAIALSFLPLKANTAVDPGTHAAARRITVVSAIFLPFIMADIIFNTILPIRFFPLLYCAYAALVIRDRLREITAAGSPRSAGAAAENVVVPGDWFFTKYRISPREREIMEHILQGMNNPAIAKKLFISVPTVKTHVRRIFQKAGVGNRFELIRFLSAQAPGSDSPNPSP